MRLSTASPDPDFERRWNAWTARGLAHDRMVRRRFIVSAQVAATVAASVLIAYTLFPW